MVNALLLSPAYGWFIGLLVVMIVVTGLFALILYIALRPINKDVSVDDVSYAKALLGRREAELTMEIMNNKGNVEIMDGLMAQLREVAVAEKLIDELANGEAVNTSAPARPVNPQTAARPARPVRPAQSQTAAARPANPQAAPARPVRPARPVKPQAAPAQTSQTPAEESNTQDE
ncbi:MAG: hypothetical protein K2L12_07590 [Clostridia bacterium]|nr:hypothetical protein [Clostridia bacterium]